MNILQGIALSFSGSAPLFIVPALGARFPLWAPAVSTQVYKYLSGSTYLLLEIGINLTLLKWKKLIELRKHWKGLQAEHPAALPVGLPKLIQQQGNLSLPPETEGPEGAIPATWDRWLRGSYPVNAYSQSWTSASGELSLLPLFHSQTYQLSAWAGEDQPL